MSMNRFKGLDWLAVVFYPLAVILMEAFWVSPWLKWVGIWPFFRELRPVLSLVSVAVVLVVSLLITRIFSRQKLPMWAIQCIIIGSGVVVMLVVLGVEYADGYTLFSGRWFAHTAAVLGESFINPGTIMIALPAIIYLWWRGIMLGQSTTYFKDIYRSFLIGLAALITLIIFWQISAASGKFEKPGPEIGLNVIAFFFFGLLAIAICHLYMMRSTMPREEAALTSVWRWLPIMLGVIGGMVLIGFGMASVLSPEIFDSIGKGFSAITGFIGKIIEYILIPIGYIVQWLIYIFRFLLGLIRGSEAESQNMTGNMGAPMFENITPKELPPWVTESIKWVVIAGIIAVIIFILARTISKLRTRRAQEEIEEIRESLFSWKGLRDDLKLLLNMMGQKFKRKAPSAPKYRFDDDAAGRMDIREIFRHLQWEGGRSGVTRYRHETASEYAYRLERFVPESGEPLNSIRDMYENVRYGETSIPEPQLDKANNLWQTLKGMIRRLRGD